MSNESVTAPVTGEPTVAEADPNWPRDLAVRLKRIGKVSMEVTVELGRVRIPLEQVANAKEGSLVQLEKLSGQPMEIMVNGALFGLGEIVVVGDNLAVRVTELTAPEDR